MAFLEISGLKKKYRNFSLSISLEVEEGELVSLIGPSGSGKSTLLSMIAGILSPDSGRILLSGEDITKKRIQDRGIGMVFQDIALFPSMNVMKNIQAGMKEKDRKKRDDLADKLLELIGLSGYGQRSVSSLSGGEAQRVALARSIAAEPRILLLDEPLSSLDAPLRKHLRAAIRSIHDSLGITMLYVTHDREEAFAVSDRIAIMHDGNVEAYGTAEELYRKPSSMFTAFFTGEGTAIPLSMVSEGEEGTLFFRPENAMIIEGGQIMPQHILLEDAEIISAEFTGDGYTLGLSWNGYQILARSIAKPRKREVSIAIPKEKAEIFRS